MLIILLIYVFVNVKLLTLDNILINKIEFLWNNSIIPVNTNFTTLKKQGEKKQW